MNLRIRELAEQAGCKVLDDGEWYIPTATGFEKIVYTKGIGLEKFAELIVQECSDIAKHHVMNISTYADAEFVEEQIKQHFGVKE